MDVPGSEGQWRVAIPVLRSEIIDGKMLRYQRCREMKGRMTVVMYGRSQPTLARLGPWSGLYHRVPVP